MDKLKNLGLRDQYFYAAESLDRSRSRRQKDNRFFIILLTGIVTIAGAGQNAGIFYISKNITAAIYLFILWAIICILWQIDLLLYNRSNRATLKILKDIEDDLTFPLQRYLINRNPVPFPLFTRQLEYLYEKPKDDAPKINDYLFKHKTLSLGRRSLPSLLLLLGAFILLTTHFTSSNEEKIICGLIALAFYFIVIKLLDLAGA